MKQPEKRDGNNGAGPAKPSRKPMKVLSTSLGVALAANLLAAPAAYAEGADAASKPQPKLVEWSTDAVKNYYDPNIDWNLALPDEKKPQTAGQESAAGSGAGGGGAAAGAAATGSGGGTNTVIVNSGGGYGGGFGGGFGWDDLLLYHLLFNNGGVYSTRSWSQSHTTVYANNSQPYQSRSYTPETFQNKPVAGSAVKPPQTSASSGSFSTGKSSASASSATKSGSGTSTGATASGGSSAVSSGAKAPSTSTSSGSFSSSSSSKSSSTSSGSIGGKSSGFSSSSGS